MGKKSRAKSGTSETKSETKSKSGKNNLWLILGGAVVMVAIVWGTLQTTNKTAGEKDAKVPDTASKAEKFTGSAPLSLIATLDPAQFTGRAKTAYQAAKEIPAVLAQLPCFCGCMRTHGHKNNLFCFMDEHGSACEICEDIAIDAKRMRNNGASVKEIQDNIKGKYSQYLPPQ